MTRYPKKEHLKHKRLFDSLFSEGNRLFKHPVLMLWSVCLLPQNVPIQVGFSVPKKHYKTAISRNRIRRWMREVYRLHKDPLFSVLNDQKKQIAICFVVQKTDNISYEEVKHKILLLLQELEASFVHD